MLPQMVIHTCVAFPLDVYVDTHLGPEFSALGHFGAEPRLRAADAIGDAIAIAVLRARWAVFFNGTLVFNGRRGG